MIATLILQFIETPATNFISSATTLLFEIILLATIFGVLVPNEENTESKVTILEEICIIK